MTLGIDIGGTTIHFGLVEGAEVVKKVSTASFAKNATLQETLDYLGDHIASVLVPGVEKIGIGVPSVTDPVKGIVYNAANIPSWKEVHLKEILEKRFGIPVFVNNDANCYALGAASRVKGATVLGVTLGTGTGVGIVIDGHLFSGPHCGAGELGAVSYNGLDYESFCSKKYFTGKGVTDIRAVSKEAQNGQEEAVELFREFGRHLGEFLAVLMYAYDADNIVFGGGIANTFPLFRDSLWETLKSRFPYENILNDLAIHVMPEEELALVGAASL